MLDIELENPENWRFPKMLEHFRIYSRHSDPKGIVIDTRKMLGFEPNSPAADLIEQAIYAAVDIALFAEFQRSLFLYKWAVIVENVYGDKLLRVTRPTRAEARKVAHTLKCVNTFAKVSVVKMSEYRK